MSNCRNKSRRTRNDNCRIRRNTYRFNINGTIILYDREHGLNIINFDICNGYEVIEALKHIIEHEQRSKKTTKRKGRSHR